jgi:transposase InsO family protein
MKPAGEAGISQKFTKVKHPQTNGKAERVIRTLMESRHSEQFANREERAKAPARFVNYYNCVRPHKGIDNETPLERLCEYLYRDEQPMKKAKKS